MWRGRGCGLDRLVFVTNDVKVVVRAIEEKERGGIRCDARHGILVEKSDRGWDERVSSRS